MDGDAISLIAQAQDGGEDDLFKLADGFRQISLTLYDKSALASILAVDAANADVPLQTIVGGNANGVFHAPLLQRLVDLRLRSVRRVTPLLVREPLVAPPNRRRGESRRRPYCESI